MKLATSEIVWKAGDTAVIKKGWDQAGKKFQVLGPAVFAQQWWVPVLDPDEEDPTYHKEAALEKFDPTKEKEYAPTTTQELMEMVFRLMVALAKRKLADANAEVKGNAWPAGQSWTDLGGTSQSTFLRLARDEAGVDSDRYLEIVRKAEIDLDDLYEKLSRTERR